MWSVVTELPEANRGPGTTWELAKLYNRPKEVYAKKEKWGRKKDLGFESICFSREEYEILSSKKVK